MFIFIYTSVRLFISTLLLLPTLYVSPFVFLCKRDTSGDIGGDAGRDTGRDIGRDAGRVKSEIEGGGGGEAVEKGWLKGECQSLSTVHLDPPSYLGGLSGQPSDLNESFSVGRTGGGPGGSRIS